MKKIVIFLVALFAAVLFTVDGFSKKPLGPCAKGQIGKFRKCRIQAHGIKDPEKRKAVLQDCRKNKRAELQACRKKGEDVPMEAEEDDSFEE